MRCWKSFETKLVTHDSLRSPSATNSREKVTRYYTASNLAAQIGELGDHLSKHTLVYDWRRDKMIRVEDHCTGCSLPDLNLDVFHDEYELFVRLSRSGDNKLFAEGFISFRELENPDCGFLQAGQRDLPLDHLHFSWPEMLELSRQMVLHGEQYSFVHGQIADETVEDLTAVVVAVDKVTSKASFVVAQSGFEWTYDDSGDYACCSARGVMSRCSHGPPDLGQRTTLLLRNSGAPDKGRFSLICDVYGD